FILSVPWFAQLYPLFPYTTLFRSRVSLPELVGVDREARHPEGVPMEAQNLRVDPRGLPFSEGRVHVEADLEPLEEREPFDVADRDRKSTRLNSSHVAISYADFCLK